MHKCGAEAGATGAGKESAVRLEGGSVQIVGEGYAAGPWMVEAAVRTAKSPRGCVGAGEAVRPCPAEAPRASGR